MRTLPLGNTRLVYPEPMWGCSYKEKLYSDLFSFYPMSFFNCRVPPRTWSWSVSLGYSSDSLCSQGPLRNTARAFSRMLFHLSCHIFFSPRDWGHGIFRKGPGPKRRPYSLILSTHLMTAGVDRVHLVKVIFLHTQVTCPLFHTVFWKDISLCSPHPVSGNPSPVKSKALCDWYGP